MSNQEMQYAQEEQKWWQNTWFIVLMIFLFFPVGLFLMYRYTKYKTAAIVLAVCIVSYSVYAHFTRPVPSHTSVSPSSSTSASTTPTAAPATTNASSSSNESVKSAFQTWNNTVQSNLKSVDSDWEQLWKGTANSLSSKSIDIYTAYNNIDNLEKRLESMRNKFLDLNVPSELSGEQRDILKDAKEKYVAWIYCRREACQKFKAMLNSGAFPPAKVKEVTDTIAQGDTFAIQAAASILDVEKQLGLLK